jgi:hypothetical protein
MRPIYASNDKALTPVLRLGARADREEKELKKTFVEM